MFIKGNTLTRGSMSFLRMVILSRFKKMQPYRCMSIVGDMQVATVNFFVKVKVFA